MSFTLESLEGLIENALDRLSADLFVSMPGTINSYDAGAGEADVTPALLRRYTGRAAPSKLPVLRKIPVLMPRCASGRVHLPLSSGDPVLLVFGDRSMENWLSGGGEPREPQRVRKHDYMDAVAIPGFSLRNAGSAPTYPDSLSLEAAPGVPIYIGNGQNSVLYGDVDIVNLLYQVITKLSETKGNLGAPLSTQADWVALKLIIEQQGILSGG